MLTHRKRGGRGGEKSQARAFGLPSWFVLALAGVLLWGAAPVAAVDLPVPTSCQIDVACAANKMVNGECPDDQPGQKDLTQFCVDDGGVVPDQDCTGGFCSVTGDVCAAAADCPQVYELHSLWNWDITALSGANTGDACTLYDTNTNGFADIAVCVTIRDGGATVELGAVRLFTCGDTRVDRCPGSTQIAGNECVGGDNDGVSCSLESDCSAGGGVCIPGPTLNTSCEVSQQDTNPFDTTFDTEALCWVDLNDFGAPGATADLLDACSYPSEQPGSDPSDCVITGCTMDSQCDDSDACTSDVCDTNTGNCVNTDITASCDDSSACTADSCDPATGCVNTDISASCVDGNACTADSCDPAVGCVNTDISASCDDTDACTADSCDPATGCVNTDITASCDDSNVCTDDSCDPATGCVNDPNDNSCGDDTTSVCTLPDSCVEGMCVPNNLPCASVTDSALCLFDVATKGICVVSDEDSTPTTDPTTACDTVQQDCPTDVFADAFCLEEQQFRLLFTPDGPNWPSYKLNASNPGQYFYNWISESPGCEPGVTMETFTVSIPFPFVTQGRNSVHIYDGFEVGNADGVDCFMPPEEAEEAFPLSITMEDWINGAGDGVENLELFCPGIGQSMLPLASGESEEFCTFEVTATYPSDSCQIYLNVHLDYGLKGKDVDGNPADTFPDRYLPMPLAVLSDYGSQDAYMRVPADGSLGGIALADCTVYPFSHVDGGGPFGDNVESLNYFKGAKGAVVGLVQSSSNGQGKSQAGVSITHPTKGPAASGDTDDDGFFWINYKHKGKPTYYTITIELDDGSEVSGEVLLKGNGFAEAYFDVDTGTVIVQDASSTGGNGKGNNK